MVVFLFDAVPFIQKLYPLNDRFENTKAGGMRQNDEEKLKAGIFEGYGIQNLISSE